MNQFKYSTIDPTIDPTMYDLLAKSGIVNVRNILTYRIIGSTIAEKIGENVLDAEYIISFIQNTHDFHCISCITYDILSSSLLVYALSYYISQTPVVSKKLEKIEKFSQLKKQVGKTIWVLLFVLSKYVETAT